MPFELVSVLARDGRQYGPCDLATLRAWAAAGQVTPDAVAICQHTGARRAVGEVLGLPPPALTPGYPPPGYPGAPGAAAGPPPFGVVDALVPINVRNGLAVVAGYLGLFSIVCLGPLLGLPAVILGVLALRRRRELGGGGRAWTGIIAGGLGSLLWLVIFIASWLH